MSRIDGGDWCRTRPHHERPGPQHDSVSKYCHEFPSAPMCKGRQQQTFRRRQCIIHHEQVDVEAVSCMNKAVSARGGQGRLGPWGRPMYISMKSLQGMNVCYEYDTGWYETEGRV